nr:EpsG family protein [Leuconostoc gasicomitatum]
MVIIAILAVVDKSQHNNELGFGILTLLFGLLEIIFFFNATKGLNFAYSDLVVYYGYFQTMMEWDWNTFQTLHPFEFGYDFVVFIIAKIPYALGLQLTAHDFVLILVILAIIVIYFAAKIQTNRSSAVFISLLYLWYQYSNVFTYNIVRQGVALAFLCLSISLYHKYNKIGTSLFVMIVAVMFHKSIFFLGLLPFFIIVYKNISKNHKSNNEYYELSIEKNRLISVKMWLFLCLGVIAYITKLNSLLGRLPISLVQTYQSDSVVTMAVDLGSITNSLHFLLLSIGYLVIISLIWYFNRKKIDDLKPFYLLFFIDTIIYLFMGFVPFSFRVEFGALYVLPLILGIIIYRTGNRLYYIALLAIVIILGYYTGPFYLLK